MPALELLQDLLAWPSRLVAKSRAVRVTEEEQVHVQEQCILCWVSLSIITHAFASQNWWDVPWKGQASVVENCCTSQAFTPTVVHSDASLILSLHKALLMNPSPFFRTLFLIFFWRLHVSMFDIGPSSLRKSALYISAAHKSSHLHLCLCCSIRRPKRCQMPCS